MLRLLRYGLPALCFSLGRFPLGKEDVDNLGEGLLKHAKGLLVLVVEAVRSPQFVVASRVLRGSLHDVLKGGNGFWNVFLAQISMTHNELRSGIAGLELEEFVSSLEGLVERLGLQRQLG